MAVSESQATFRLLTLSYHLGGQALLEGIHAEVREGKVTAILGGNGAGKSTLLKVLAGQLTPSHGEVSFQRRTLGSWSPRELARIRAVLPQNTAVPFAFTAAEIVGLGRAPHGDSHAAKAIITQCLEQVDAAHLHNRAVNTLSGGEAQRVHLARALCQISGVKHATLLLDEPTSALDPFHQHTLLQTIRQTARQGATVLVVLHDLNLALQYADHALLMRKGRLHAAGPITEVLNPASISGIFGVKAHFVDHPASRCPAVLLSVDEADIPLANETRSQ